MADERKNDKASPEAPTYSAADMAKARAWFNKAADCRERREYDYAIECYMTGLGFWPEAVDEGHMLLHSVAVQRQQVGGKRPGMMEGLRKPLTGKDARQCTLNAEYLLAKDPNNAGYLDALLKNANRAGLVQTVKWVAPLVFDSLRRDKKLDKGRFKVYREALIEAATRAEAQGDAASSNWLLEQALASLDYLLARLPGDEDLRLEQRDVSGKLAIGRGKYEEAESFQESLQDGEKQKLLHDSERVKQGEQTFQALLGAARKEWEENPIAPQKIHAYADLLLREETKAAEYEAIQVLMQAYEQTRAYSFKMKADEVRLRQLARQTRQLTELARQSDSDEDRQQLRLAKMEQRQYELEVYRDRVANYPTDLRLKYQLGKSLYEAQEYDEAIPVLQEARVDPRSRHRCQYLIGRAFFEKENYQQAIEVLREMLDVYELTDDLSKDATYWLARSFEAVRRVEDAKTAYGRLLRQDYNYAQGDARKRMENLK